MEKNIRIELTKKEVSDIIKDYLGIERGSIDFNLTSEKLEAPLEFDGGRGCGDMSGYYTTVFGSVTIQNVILKPKKKWYQW